MAPRTARLRRSSGCSRAVSAAATSAAIVSRGWNSRHRNGTIRSTSRPTRKRTSPRRIRFRNGSRDAIIATAARRAIGGSSMARRSRTPRLEDVLQSSIAEEPTGAKDGAVGDPKVFCRWRVADQAGEDPCKFGKPLGDQDSRLRAPCEDIKLGGCEMLQHRVDLAVGPVAPRRAETTGVVPAPANGSRIERASGAN